MTEQTANRPGRWRASDEPVPWDEARRTAHRIARPSLARTVALPEALGAPLVALTGFPVTDRSATDGFAVRGLGPCRLRQQDGSAWSQSVPLGAAEATRVVARDALPAGHHRAAMLREAAAADALAVVEPTSNPRSRRFPLVRLLTMPA